MWVVCEAQVVTHPVAHSPAESGQLLVELGGLFTVVFDRDQGSLAEQIGCGSISGRLVMPGFR